MTVLKIAAIPLAVSLLLVSSVPSRADYVPGQPIHLGKVHQSFNGDADGDPPGANPGQSTPSVTLSTPSSTTSGMPKVESAHTSAISTADAVLRKTSANKTTSTTSSASNTTSVAGIPTIELDTKAPKVKFNQNAPGDKPWQTLPLTDVQKFADGGCSKRWLLYE